MRPGRIDRIFEISYADADALYELFLQYYPGIQNMHMLVIIFLSGKKKQANLFKNYVVGRNITTAYIQNFFLKYKVHGLFDFLSLLWVCFASPMFQL